MNTKVLDISGAAEAIILGFVTVPPLLIVGFNVNVIIEFNFVQLFKKIGQKPDQNDLF